MRAVTFPVRYRTDQLYEHRETSGIADAFSPLLRMLRKETQEHGLDVSKWTDGQVFDFWRCHGAWTIPALDFEASCAGRDCGFCGPL
jgi:hypothetical protein